MTIKQQGGIFGRNPVFNDLEANFADVRGLLKVSSKHNENFIQLSSTNTVDEAFVKLASTDLVIDHDPTGARSSSDIVLNSDGVEVLRIKNGDSGGDLQPLGNVVLAEGQGIDFSATSGSGTSELFSDYEEGSWSPVISDATSGGNTGTATVAYATYTKVGNLVHLKARLLNMNTTGMGSGNLYVQGAPYAADGDGEGLASMSHFTSAANSLGIVPSIDNGASHIKLKEIISGSNYINADSSQFNSGTADLWITITYHT